MLYIVSHLTIFIVENCGTRSKWTCIRSITRRQFCRSAYVI